MADKAFLGRGWAFPPEFNNNSGRVIMVSEDEDIEQSLKILLSTTPGERIMLPAYGCGLKSLVFENVTESTVTEIKDVVARAILFFEPRINLESIEIETTDEYEGFVKVLINYRVRETDSRRNMVYPFYFRDDSRN